MQPLPQKQVHFVEPHGPVAFPPAARFSVEPTYDGQMGAPGVRTLNDYNRALQNVQRDINIVLDQHKFAKHVGRAVTVVGSLAAIGGAGALAVGAVSGGVLGAAGLPTLGASLPPAALAAIVGVGALALGLGVAAATGAIARRLARKSLANDPNIANKLDTLRAMRAALMAQKELTKPEKALLKNITRVLGKVEGGLWQTYKTQMKVAGKTTLGVGAAALAVAVLFVAAQGLDSVDSFHSVQLFDGSTGGGTGKNKSLGGKDGPVDLGHKSEGWLQSLFAAPSTTVA